VADVFCLAMIDRGEQEDDVLEKMGREQVVKQNLVKEKEKRRKERKRPLPKGSQSFLLDRRGEHLSLFTSEMFL